MSKPSTQPTQGVSTQPTQGDLTRSDKSVTYPTALAQLIDEYGDLDAKVTLFKPTLVRHEETRKLIQVCYGASAADQSFIEHGARFTCIVGQRENERKITDMRKLAKLLKDRFFSICSVPLKKLDAELPADQHIGLVTQARTGTRSVKVVPKAA